MRNLSNIALAVMPVASMVAALIGAIATIEPAAAITIELANKCREMAINSHPPPVPVGNKAYAAAERSFFQECVKRNGDMKDDGSPSNKGSDRQNK